MFSHKRKYSPFFHFVYSNQRVFFCQLLLCFFHFSTVGVGNQPAEGFAISSFGGDVESENICQS